MMMATARRASRAPPISRVRATCRVPFGLMPVIAATPVMRTTSASHPSQLMMDDSIHVEPGRACCTYHNGIRTTALTHG